MIPPTRYIDAGPGVPLANPQVAMMQGEAMARMGNTIAQVGEMGFKIAERVRKIEEGGKMSALYANMEEDAARFSLELMKREDTANWPAEWKQRSGKWMEEARKQGLSPDALAEFQERYTDWNTRRSIGFEAMAANKAVELGRGRISNAYDYHVGQENWEGAASALQDGRDSGLFNSVEFDEATMKLAEAQAEADYRARMADDPAEVLRVLGDDEYQDPALPAGKRRMLKREAENAVQDKRIAQMDEMEVAYGEGELTLEKIEAARYLTPKDKLAAKKMLSANTPPDPAAHSAAWKVLFETRDKYNDPSISDEQYAKEWNDSRAKVMTMLPPEFQGDIKQELSYRSPANRRTGKLEEATAADFRVLAIQHVVKAFDDGALGDVTDPKSDSTRAAFRRMQDAKAEVIRFIKANPEASWPEVKNATSRALGMAIEDDDAPVIPSAPAAINFDTRLNSILGIPEGTGNPDDPSLLPPLND